MRALKTLIVDDDRDLADSLGILLGLEGHRVSLAYDAQQALANPGGEAFDIILIDIQLPDRSGLDCLVELRRAHPRADVVLMTAYGVAEAVNRARERGALGILLKPLAVEELSSMLKLLAGGFVPVAEASPGLVGRLTKALEDKRYAASVVRPPEEAKAAAAGGAADVVVLDLTPEVLDPADLAEALGECGERVPVVVFGGIRDEGEEAEGTFGLSVTGCFAGARDESHVLERIEKVRDYYEHGSCNKE